MDVQPVSANIGAIGTRPEHDAKPVPPPQRASAPPSAVPAATDIRQPPPVELTPQALEEAVQRVEEFVKTSGSEINFSIDSESGMRIVKVTDKVTDEVIRQIPSEEVVAIARALDKLQGLFLRDKV